MAPDFGDTQVMTPTTAVDSSAADDSELPSMHDLDTLVGELDEIDEILAALR